MVENFLYSGYNTSIENIRGIFVMSEIVKVCKVHGSLTIDQVKMEGSGRMRCHQCRLESNTKWRENNREKHVEASTRWKKENRERVNEWAKQDREKDPVKYSVWSKATKLRNRDKILEDGREYAKRTRHENYDEFREKEKKRYAEDKDSFYKYHAVHRYKVTKEELNKFLSNFDDKCTICRNPETRKTRNGGISRLCIDHCHTTGKLRALLCHNCNNMIGAAKDSIELLKAAIDYLQKYGGDDASILNATSQ